MIPKEMNYSMPAEWKQHECCWMQWPHDNSNFSAYGQVPTWSHFDIEKGRIAWTNVAKAISEFEKVKMIVHPDNVENAKKLLDSENSKEMYVSRRVNVSIYQFFVPTPSEFEERWVSVSRFHIF